jgi:hypothetical protein
MLHLFMQAMSPTYTLIQNKMIRATNQAVSVHVEQLKAFDQKTLLHSSLLEHTSPLLLKEPCFHTGMSSCVHVVADLFLFHK